MQVLRETASIDLLRLRESSELLRPSSTSQTDSPSPTVGYWPDVSLIGVAVIWGVNIPLMKTGLDQIDVFVFNAIRLTISASVLSSWAIRERRCGILPKPTMARKHVVIYAMVVGLSYQLMFLLGVSRTTSGNAALIIATVPMWTALLAHVFIRERLLRLAWLGLVIAFVGTAIVAFQKGDVTAGRAHLHGNLVILGAALLWSGGTVYSRPLLQQISPLQLAASSTVIALPIHWLFAFKQVPSNFPALASPNLWLIIVYSGVLSSGLAQPMWHFGVRHAGAAHAAIIQNLIPLVAIGAAWLSRGEVATEAQWFGGILILGGLVTMRFGRSVSSNLT